MELGEIILTYTPGGLFAIFIINGLWVGFRDSFKELRCKLPGGHK